MHPDDDYRLVLRSDGDTLHICVDGDPAMARVPLLEVARAAKKFGIPIKVTRASVAHAERSTTDRQG